MCKIQQNNKDKIATGQAYPCTCGIMTFYPDIKYHLWPPGQILDIYHMAVMVKKNPLSNLNLFSKSFRLQEEMLQREDAENNLAAFRAVSPAQI